jgi:hypothetical protein
MRVFLMPNTKNTEYTVYATKNAAKGWAAVGSTPYKAVAEEMAMVAEFRGNKTKIEVTG